MSEVWSVDRHHMHGAIGDPRVVSDSSVGVNSRGVSVVIGTRGSSGCARLGELRVLSQLMSLFAGS